MARKPKNSTTNVPKSVKEAAEAAERLHEQLYGPQEPAEGSDGEVTDSDNKAPADDATKNGETASPVEAADVSVSDGQPAEAETSSTTAEASEAGPGGSEEVISDPHPSKEGSSWEARYRSLKGKYDEEVPRMMSEIHALRQQMQALMAAQTPVEQETTAQESIDVKKEVVSEQDMLDYGEDLIDLIKRIASAVASEAVSNLTPKIEQIEGRVTETAKRQVVETVYDRLDREVPEWREVNKDAKFLEWLNTMDMFAGKTRGDMLHEAYERGDAPRVTAFFKAFLAEDGRVGAPQPPADATTASHPPQQRSSGNGAPLSMERLAGPTGGVPGNTGGPTTATEGVRAMTRQEIADFYRRVAAGEFRNRPDDQRAFERRIQDAMLHNAIV